MITIRSFGGRLSLRLDVRTAVVGVLLGVATAATGVWALTSGDFPLTGSEVLRALVGAGTPASEFVVHTLRLPRLVTGILVGAALGGAGAVFQSLTRNPLGSPDLIGFTQGSATGGIAVILVTGGAATATAVGAVVGGFATAVLLYLLAWRGGLHGYRLVLVGVGVTAVLGAVNSYLLTRATLGDAQRAVAWQIGSLAGRDWEHVAPIAVTLAIGVPALLALGRPLRTLELGDDAALGLGVLAQRSRAALLLVAVGLTAVSTATAGPVPFVALAAPQLARRLTGAAGPNVVPALAMGALLVVAADHAAQHLFSPTQLPLGVVTAVGGGLYLVWLLVWQRRRPTG